MVDIRDFLSGKSRAAPKKDEKKSAPVKKTKRAIVDSDDESGGDIEEIESIAKPTSKRAKTESLEPVEVSDYFNKRSSRTGVSKPAAKREKSSPKKKSDTIVVLDSDDDFNFSDDEESTKASAVFSAEPQSPIRGDQRDSETKKTVKSQDIGSSKASSISPTKSKSAKTTAAASPVKPVSASTGESQSAENILQSIVDADLPEPEDTTGKSFKDFKARQATLPQPNGYKDIPVAAPDCLSGLTMVFTGVLPTLDRDSAENLAKRYGAKVTKSISKKTSVVVIGEEAGPSKVKKIRDFKIKAITEDGFLELLSKMPIGGGDSVAAQKAREKKEEEARKIVEEAEQEERKSQLEEQKRQKEYSKAKESNSNDELPQIITPSMKSNDEKLWTVKYAPSDTAQLCGNKGQIAKLQRWLGDWFNNAKNGFKGGSDGNGIYRACLISGPPGIGKTSAAHLIAKSLGYDVLEKNASDVRSKSLLNTNIKSVLNNTSVVGFFHQQDASKDATTNKKKFCLIMDEVDGMSSGDHGGAGQLSAFCKITQMPIILICNDKSLPKMRTFDRVVLDLPFRRPSEAEVRSRLMTIAHREKIKLDPSVIGQLVECTNHDIRQMINLLSTVSKTETNIDHKNSKDISKSWAKQVSLKPFEITAKLLSGQIYTDNSSFSLSDKIELYFNDIDFTPLMIQENYLRTRPMKARNALSHLQLIADAADSISESDHINSLIRSGEQQWSLLPFHAVMSSVRPCSYAAGNITGQIGFAGWLGQNSKQLKYQRLLQELQYHTRLKTSTDKAQLRLEYVPRLVSKLTTPLLKHESEGISKVIDIMDEYYLSKEDWEYLLDFGIGNSNGDNILRKISTKTKTAFTRTYNSSSHPVAIYKTGNSVAAPSKKQKVDFEDVVDDDMEDINDDDPKEDDGKIDLKKDKLIKAVKPRKKPATKGTTKATKTTKKVKK